MTQAEIEQVKHTASWLNSLATAISTVGALAPFLAFITGTLPGTIRLDSLWAVGLICFAMAVTIHFIGREILAEIRP